MDLEGEVKTIRNAPLFRGMDPCKMRLLACISEQLSFAPGEYVVEKGEHSDAAYVILDGEIEFVAHGANGETVLGRQGAGTIFGEVALLCDSARSACVRAVTPLSVMRINKDCFLRMMQDNPQFSMAIAQELARRVMRLAERIEPELTH
jgi:CRP-like cAMP-binding protein